MRNLYAFGAVVGGSLFPCRDTSAGFVPTAVAVRTLHRIGKCSSQHKRSSQNQCKPLFFFAVLVFLIVSGITSGESLANTTNGPGSSCGENTGNTDTPCAASTDNTNGSVSDPGSTFNPLQPGVMIGNPINLITGNKYQNDTDIKLNSSRLGWQRHYNSANANYDFGLGRGWSATFLVLLQSINNNGAALLQSNGRRVLFDAPTQTTATDGQSRYVWKATTPSDGTLHTEGDFVHWSIPDGRTLRFKGAFLVDINFPGKARLSMFYKNNRLISVTDEYGLQLQFSYYESSNALPDYSVVQQQFLDHNGQPIYGAAPARLKTLTRPDGQTIEYDYDTFGNLTRVRYADGTSRIYHYEHPVYFSHLTGVTDRRGIRTNTWEYNEQGLAVRSERANGVERTELQYDLPSIIGGIGYTHVTNSLGEQSTYTWQRYPDQGQSLLLASEGAGCSNCPAVGMTYTYTDNFQLSESRHTSGRGKRWEYDDLGRTIASYIIGTDGSQRLIQRLSYELSADDTAHSSRPRSIETNSVKPGDYRRVELSYNPEGQPVEIKASGFKPEINPVDRAAITDAESESGPVAVIIGYTPIERTTSFAYSEGRLTEINGPRDDVEDRVILNYHDQENDEALDARLASIDLPGGQKIVLSQYNEFGQPTEIRQNQESPIQLTYSSNLQLTSITREGNSLTYHYDAEGRVTGMTDADNQRTQLKYDDAGRLEKIDGPRGQQQWVHDTESRPIEALQFGYDGSEIRNLALIYDSLGYLSRQVETRTNYTTGAAIDRQTAFTRNAGGEITESRDTETGLSLNYDWNPFGELVSFSKPFFGLQPLQNLSGERAIQMTRVTTQIGRDSTGSYPTITDALDNTTIYYSDDFGNHIAEHNPDTGTTVFERDNAGNAILKTNSDGTVTTSTYDAANRVIVKANSNGITTFEYHPVHGKLIRTENPSTTETFDYENARLTSHTRDIDGYRFVTTYQYDERGRLQRKGLPDGTQLRYHYYQDAGVTDVDNSSLSNAGQLKAITRESLLGLKQETLIGQIDTDASDGRMGYIDLKGSVIEKRFHPDGSLESIRSSQGLHLQYDYDDAGQIVGVNQNGMYSSYEYLNGHLASLSNDNEMAVYRYDAIGNRIYSLNYENDDKKNAKAESLHYASKGKGSRLLKTDRGDYHYTSSGATLQSPEFRFVYNSDQRPTHVYKADQLIAEYGYNSFGERVKKIVYEGGSRTVSFFLYDESRMSAEINLRSSAAEIEEFNLTIYLGSAPAVYIASGDIYSVESDHLGTPYSVTDDAGRTVWLAEYTPFGEATIVEQTLTFNHRFPGQYFDAETGNHYNYLRDYDPEIGRYLSSDPIGLLGGPNTYLYAHANPLMFIDPLGLISEIDDTSRVILTSEDFQRLAELANANRRTEYYFLLHNLTGSRLAFEMAQISSNSEQVGGVAWAANNIIEARFPHLYPQDADGNTSVSLFSTQIFMADFTAIQPHMCTAEGLTYAVPTDLEMIEVALGVWDSHGLRDVAPPLIRYYLETLGAGGDASLQIDVGNELFFDRNDVPDEYQAALEIIAEATDEEVMFIDFSTEFPFIHITDSDDLHGFYEPEFIRDHTEYEVEFSADCLSKLIRAPVESRVESLSDQQIDIYNNVAASPTHDVIVVMTNSAEYHQCLAAGQ